VNRGVRTGTIKKNPGASREMDTENRQREGTPLDTTFSLKDRHSALTFFFYLPAGACGFYLSPV
jgi:hypothetical protein